MNPLIVTPAKAGAQSRERLHCVTLDPGLRRDDERGMER
jgi:hypothetical protein